MARKECDSSPSFLSTCMNSSPVLELLTGFLWWERANEAILGGAWFHLSLIAVVIGILEFAFIFGHCLSLPCSVKLLPPDILVLPCAAFLLRSGLRSKGVYFFFRCNFQ